ncbi:MAG TPA: hypothetical protein VK348_10780, partial [Planctomycetota bacterium]|nr:hypothetical protein [Planctomycetota bacterium]
MNHAALLACGLSLLSVVATPRLAAQDLHARHGARAAVQDPRGGRLATARAQFACVDRFGERVVATGRDWRATFGVSDFEFVPALGKKSPRTFPLRLQLESIHCGDQLVLDAKSPPGERSNDRRSVTFARGGVTERYEARPEGLEQTFTIAQRPAGHGDLVVRLGIATDLQAADPGDGTLAWRAPGIGGVVLGKLNAVDAVGQHFAGVLRRDGSSVELVLPAPAVAAAVFPLVLDPLIGSSIEAFANADCDFPDAAYDPYTDSYCVVWTMYLGGSSSAAVGSVFLASDLSNAYAFQVNQSGHQDSVRVAHIGGSGMFLLVWSHLENNTIEISGLGLDPGQAQATNPFTIAGPGNVDAPAIGGEATPFGDSCVVIWDDASFGVVGCTVAIDVNLGVTLGNLVLVGGGTAATEVSIS